jgi:signal peptidase I
MSQRPGEGTKREDLPVDDQGRRRSFLKELPVLLVIALAIAFLVKTFLVQAFWIPTGSMEDTLKKDDRVLVSKLAYRIGEPRAGDIIVFVAPPGEAAAAPQRSAPRRFLESIAHGLGIGSSETDLIKRLIALGGQTVEIKEGRVFVDGRQLTEPYLKDQRPLPPFGPYRVPHDSLFVMGDNRFGSHDSRAFNAVKRSSVLGRAFLRMWPPGRFGSLQRTGS